MKCRKGFSTLMLCLVLSVLAVGFLLVLFSFQTIDIRQQVHGENLRLSSLAAQNSLSLAHAYIGEDRDWGKDGTSIFWHDGNGSYGRVRFRHADGESEPTGEQVQVGPQPPDDMKPWDESFDSVNNLGGENAVVGYDGIIVPPNSILVVAVGECRGRRQVAYQIYNGSPQPYSLGAEGSLEVKGETLVAGLESLEEAATLPSDPTQDPSSGTQHQDAGLVSNDGGADAVVLDGEIQIVGDVEAVGQIQKGAQVTIEGDEKPNSSAQDFPKIDFDSWDPKGNPSDPSDDRVTLVERTESVVNNAIQNPLYGFQRFSGDVHFPDGLKLDGSAIYVDGNVTFDGPVQGSGLIVARGNVTMNGGSDMKADVMAAVLAEGDLTVSGYSGQPSTFQGLLYSTGNLTLSNTRTIGTAISASDAQGVPGKLVVEDSTVIATPDTSDFRIVLKKYGPAAPGGLGGIDAGGGQGDGNGWQLLEPNPADLLVDDRFQWDPSHLKIRIEQPDGSWIVIDTPAEALAAGLATGEFNSLRSAYFALEEEWRETRVPELQSQYEQELVDILDFNLNEFLKVSSQLKAKQIFYVD